LNITVLKSLENAHTGVQFMEETLKMSDTKTVPIAPIEQSSTTVNFLKDEERVMGYHRPVSGYNIGKKQEFADRTNFKEPL
jgi:hypothetical protein